MCEKIKGYAKKKSLFAEYTDMPKRNTAYSGMGYPIADRTAAASARRVRTVRWSSAKFTNRLCERMVFRWYWQ